MANIKYEYVKSFKVEDEIMLPNIIIIRVDARDFCRFSEVHEFEKPNDKKALELMNDCAKAVLEQFPDVIFSYGLGDRIKATIPQNVDVYDSGSKGPSAGDFRADIIATMKQIVQFLRDNNTPFVVNIYLFLSLSLNPDFPVEYAFFSGGVQPVQDGGITYTNVLDANLDTLLWSLRKAGCGDIMEISWYN